MDSSGDVMSIEDLCFDEHRGKKSIPNYDDLSTTQKDIVELLMEELAEFPSETLSFLEDELNAHLNKRYDYLED